MEKILGVIADDFTGASDAASFLVNAGMTVVLFNGTPQTEEDVCNCRAAVIALKSRTQKTDEAVRETLEAADWLSSHGADQIYIKYCSTFDSTPEGNIGPVMDAMVGKFGVQYSILCPSLPVNGRTVINGDLYVNGVPLHESPMRNHPLTPMWDCNVSNLMEAQSQYKCISVGKISDRDEAELQAEIDEFGKGKEHFYVIPDYETNEDARRITELFGILQVLSGGSGLLEYIAEIRLKGETAGNRIDTGIPGKGLLLAGSCSEATLRQISYMQSIGISSLKMDPAKLLEGTQTEQDIWNFISNNEGTVLIYSSDTPEKVRKNQEMGQKKTADLLEKTMAEIARLAVRHGFTRLIVAGGETSGSVTKALGFSSFYIGGSVAPGVPVMIPTDRPEIRLVLKSGNFGQDDFFLRALEMTGE